MARNIQKRGAAEAPEELNEQVQADKAPMLGGTPGVMAEPVMAVVAGGPQIAPPKPFEKRASDVVTKQYRVTEQKTIMAGGFLTVMKVGKVVNDTCYDMELLRRQGLALVEVVEE